MEKEYKPEWLNALFQSFYSDLANAQNFLAISRMSQNKLDFLSLKTNDLIESLREAEMAILKTWNCICIVRQTIFDLKPEIKDEMLDARLKENDASIRRICEEGREAELMTNYEVNQEINELLELFDDSINILNVRLLHNLKEEKPSDIKIIKEV